VAVSGCVFPASMNVPPSDIEEPGRALQGRTHGQLLALGGMSARLHQRQFRDEDRTVSA
jgi:hypothetical protein